MRKRDSGEPDTDTVIVERSGAGAIVVTSLVVVAVLAVLHYFGLLPL